MKFDVSFLLLIIIFISRYLQISQELWLSFIYKCSFYTALWFLRALFIHTESSPKSEAKRILEDERQRKHILKTVSEALPEQLLGGTPKCKFLANLQSKESESPFARTRGLYFTSFPQAKWQSESYPQRSWPQGPKPLTSNRWLSIIPLLLKAASMMVAF